MKKIEKELISYGIETRLNLIAFILLNIDLNYSDIVPNHHGLVFCRYLNSGIKTHIV
jgi:hypothetical protein